VVSGQYSQGPRSREWGPFFRSESLLAAPDSVTNRKKRGKGRFSKLQKRLRPFGFRNASAKELGNSLSRNIVLASYSPR
jgi:hypothetical protein